MEIFFIGIIIVALMVYASTKLKKFTARAFEREEIDAPNFSLIKPEGFLHVLNDESKFAFYAYSKEFGKGEAEEMRQAEIFIKSYADKSFAEVCDGIKTGAENIVTFSDAEKICLIETEKMVEETDVSEIYKIIESGKVYELKISVLTDFKEDYQERIDEILESFRVK